jgi:peptidoglycan hydrolase CwlO-like protein
MQLQIERSRISLENIADRILSVRRITKLDRNMLESAILSQKFLSRAEQTLMTRVFDGLHQGSIQVVE